MTSVFNLDIIQGNEINAKMRKFHKANKTANELAYSKKLLSKGRHTKVMYRLLDLEGKE